MLTTILLLTCQVPPVALASTSGDSRLPQDPIVHDEAWIRRQEGPPGAAVWLSQHGLMALLGDLDGDGLFEAPGDIDALAWSPRGGGLGPAPPDFLFSTVSTTPAYADGDLLGFAGAQGLRIVIPEAEFVNLLQPASGSFDLDAAAFQGDELWFSVTSDLTGTILGDVADGDILAWDRLAGTVRVAWTEADVQAMVDQATGGGGSVGDVLALSFYPPTGELAFTVQSPSAHDATVFGTGNGGRILPGFEEPDWDFQQATELDALAFVPGGIPQPPVMATDVPFYGQGVPVRFTGRHGTPGAIVEGYLAGAPGLDDRPGEGIGAFYLDLQDPFLLQQVALGHTHPRPFDASGSATFDWTSPVLPASMPWLDLYFQCYDHGGGGWSAPIVLRIQ